MFICSTRRAYSMIHISFHSMAYNYVPWFIIVLFIIIIIIIIMVNIDSVKITSRLFKLKVSYLFPPSRE